MRIQKNPFFALMFAASLCACLAVPALAQTPEVSRVEGTLVEADFESVDPAGCIFTSTYVSVSQSGTTSFTTLLLVIYRWSECGGGFEELAYAYAETELPSGALTTQGHLGSASLEATVEVYDLLSGSTSFVPISLVWDGEGEVVRSRFTSTLQSASLRFSQRSTGLSRDASVSGSLLFEGSELAAAPPAYATFSTTQIRTLTVDKN